MSVTIAQSTLCVSSQEATPVIGLGFQSPCARVGFHPCKWSDMQCLRLAASYSTRAWQELEAPSKLCMETTVALQ